MFHVNGDLFVRILVALAELLAAYVAGGLVDRLITAIARSHHRKGTFTFLASFVNLAIKIFGVVLALDELGVSMNYILSAITALGLGLSLALRDNMTSVASGLQLLVTKPFKVGDYIEVGKHEGTVRAIELTYTVLETRNNNIVILNNSKLITKSLINYSSTANRRLAISYTACIKDTQAKKEMLLNVARQCSLILDSPCAEVIIDEIASDQIKLELVCYSRADAFWKAQNELMEAIYQKDVSTIEAHPLRLSKYS